MPTKLEGEGVVKALVFGPLIEELFLRLPLLYTSPVGMNIIIQEDSL